MLWNILTGNTCVTVLVIGGGDLVNSTYYTVDIDIAFEILILKIKLTYTKYRPDK